MKVYVVTGNDFPKSVFTTEAEANSAIVKYKDKEIQQPRIYWRVYKFELQGKGWTL